MWLLIIIDSFASRFRVAFDIFLIKKFTDCNNVAFTSYRSGYNSSESFETFELLSKHPEKGSSVQDFASWKFKIIFLVLSSIFLRSRGPKRPNKD